MLPVFEHSPQGYCQHQQPISGGNSVPPIKNKTYPSRHVEASRRYLEHLQKQLSDPEQISPCMVKFERRFHSSI